MQPLSDSHQPHALAEELNKALERPQPHWIRLIVSNLKAYVKLRAAEVGEVPRRADFKGKGGALSAVRAQCNYLGV